MAVVAAGSRMAVCSQAFRRRRAAVDAASAAADVVAAVDVAVADTVVAGVAAADTGDCALGCSPAFADFGVMRSGRAVGMTGLLHSSDRGTPIVTASTRGENEQICAARWRDPPHVTAI